MRLVHPSVLQPPLQIEHFGSTEEFLRLMAVKKGKLRKGGGLPQSIAMSRASDVRCLVRPQAPSTR